MVLREPIIVEPQIAVHAAPAVKALVAGVCAGAGVALIRKIACIAPARAAEIRQLGKPGQCATLVLQLLEGRLDNVVFRLGIAPTRAAARQLVGHKHITVDGEVVNIPSYAVKPGQLIGVRERSKSLEVIANSLAGFNHSKYAWLEWDEASKVGKMLHIPERADIPENIKEHLIVELYSK